MKYGATLNKSHDRMIIDSFLKQNAVSEKSSICYKDIKVLKNDAEKQYLINSLIKDGYVIQENDDTLWFNKKKWDGTVKRFTVSYLAILIGPILITLIIMLIIKMLYY